MSSVLKRIRKKSNYRNPEIDHGRDFGLWELEFHKQDRVREYGRNVIRWVAERRVMNNDDLAHVRQLAEAGGVMDGRMLNRIYIDYLTDMGERAPDLCHYHQIPMQLISGELISGGGLNMNESLLKSLEATKIDASLDRRREYGLAREQIQLKQMSEIIQWSSGANFGSMYGFASLCPSGGEIDSETAKINGFKTDRELASIWIYEKSSAGGLALHALSLEHCTLGRFQRLLDLCGVEHHVSASTMDQLARGINFSSTSVKDLRAMWREILAIDGLSIANDDVEDRVRSRPEAFELYLEFVREIEHSLRKASATRRLNSLLRKTGIKSMVDISMMKRFDAYSAEKVMGFVRSRMIPHYLHGQEIFRDGSTGGVLAISTNAEQRTEAYDSSCPSSSTKVDLNQQHQSHESAMERFINMEILNSQKRKGDCIACGTEKTTVYGCGFCRDCHHSWGKEYLSTGKMLSINEVRQRSKNKKKVQTRSETPNKFRLFSFW